MGFPKRYKDMVNANRQTAASHPCFPKPVLETSRFHADRISREDLLRQFYRPIESPDWKLQTSFCVVLLVA